MANPAAQDADPLRWRLGSEEQKQLDLKFKVRVLECLRAVESDLLQGRDLTEQALALARAFEEAAQTLDQCSLNCHTMAATLRHYAGLTDQEAAELSPPGLAGRAHAAAGSPVVVLRTTIAELHGEVLVLDAIEDGHAVLRQGDDYWGTPVDRLLVLAPPADDDAETDGAVTQASPALSPKAGEFLESLRQKVRVPVIVAASGNGNAVRMHYPPEDLDEVVPIEELPESLRSLLEANGNGRGAGIRLHTRPAAVPDTAIMYFELRCGELSNAIQFLSLTSYSGSLEIHFPGDGSSGIVFIANNRVIHARYEELTGVSAIASMLLQPVALGSFHLNRKPDEETIAQNTDQLLVEAAVKADETGSVVVPEED